MKVVVNENVSEQIYNCMKKTAIENGYEIVESFMYESGYEESLCKSLYVKCNWFAKMLGKKPICHFDYSDCTMYVYDIKDYWDYYDVLELVIELFKNIEGLTIKIDKNFRYCD